MYGELVPLGGGDSIPLLKEQLLVGRRESCDIVLRFANVSAHHCQLSVDNGYLYVRDLQSRNGIKVNEVRVTERRLDPGDIIAISKHRYRVDYDPAELGAIGPPPPDEVATKEVMQKSLLSRAGLEHRDFERDRSPKQGGRFNVLDNSAGQIRLPDDPL